MNLARTSTPCALQPLRPSGIAALAVMLLLPLGMLGPANAGPFCLDGDGNMHPPERWEDGRPVWPSACSRTGGNGDEPAGSADEVAESRNEGRVGGDGDDQAQSTAATSNGAPAFRVEATDRTATVDVAFSHAVPEATDPEGGPVTYSAALSDGSALPDWLGFDAATRTFSGTPREGDAPASLVIWITAADDGSPPLTDTTSFTLTVVEAAGVPETRAEPPIRWLARFGRTAAGQTVDAVTARFAQFAGADPHLALGGRHIGVLSLVNGSGTSEAVEPRSGRSSGSNQRSPVDRGGGSRAGTGPRWTAWGRAALEGLEGREGGQFADSDVVTGVFGVDREHGGWLAGVALSHSVGVTVWSPRGTALQYGVDGTVTTVSPYFGLRLSGRLLAWALAGRGRGGLALTQGRSATKDDRIGATVDDTSWETDFAMTFGAAGVRGELLTPEAADGLSLALKGDALLVRTTSAAIREVEGLGSLAAAEAGASRVRLVLEGSRAIALDDGTLTPSFELGLLRDGGDAGTGAGVSLGGGLKWSDPSSRLSMDLNAHALLAHAGSDRREWGVSGALRLAPDSRGRGISLSLAQTLGDGPGGAGAVWSARNATGLLQGGVSAETARLDGELAYGLPVRGDRFTGTPYAGLSATGAETGVRVGWRLRPSGDAPLRFSVETTRREVDGDEPDHGIGIRFTSRW
ncbi:MAG: putative Ig domain-containing protein [Boseongicola sp.]|nr:putative Ig domain-containing protein [Boseongicola sp.]